MTVSSEFIEKIGSFLNKNANPLKLRFRALFTLKNLGGNAAIDEIAKCFSDKSALLKHELAYCLGQMRNSYAIPKLVQLLEDASQEVIVRHEAGNLAFYLSLNRFKLFTFFTS
jgi:deoxyhypusine monooxygenase